MNTLGIIVEYNPFHNGHLYHLQQAKKLTSSNTTIAVMSGSFLQRGEPAIVDKWTRAEMAINNGVDIVIELPTIYATQSADLFAFGSISLLNYLQVDNLVFGSENNSLEMLNKISDLLLNETPKFKEYIKYFLSLGHSYPKALSLSLSKYFSNDQFNEIKPNDILGIQYILNLKKINSNISPNTIKRVYADYNDKNFNNSNIASATAIRKTFFTKHNLENISPYVPKETYDLLMREFNLNRINSWENYLNTLLIIANNKSNHELNNIHGIVEGFEQRIKDNLYDNNSFNDFIEKLKTKRYTSTKIQRTLFNILLNISKKTVEELNIYNGPTYIRVLSFNDNGRKYLNKIKHQLQIPLVTKIPRDKPSMLELDILASNIYELGLHKSKENRVEYKQAPIYR